MTPSVKPDCIENLPLDVNSAPPVQIDQLLLRTSDGALPSEELFEPPPASEKERTTHATQVGNSDKESGFVNTTSATKERALAVQVSMESDYLETNEDGDLSTVVLVDKGKGVDPQEYGIALYDPKSMTVPAGSTSTGSESNSIELVAEPVHRDKGKNVDREERGSGMAKYEPGPSRIYFHHSSSQKQDIPLQSFEPVKTKDLGRGPPHDPTLPRLSWHPKISPYRFILFLTPIAIGTAKAVSAQKGSVVTPITLEWIYGVVIFLV